MFYSVEYSSCVHHTVRNFLHLLPNFHASAVQSKGVVLDSQILINPLQVAPQSLQGILSLSEFLIQCSDGATYFSHLMAHLVLGLVSAQLNIWSVSPVLQTCLRNLNL